jgi:murein DD-endopeptidase MepM/ murein hydrolase activator NlpD
MHNGTDYSTGGQKWPLYAIESGTVVQVGEDGSRGKYVNVDYPRIKKRLLHYHLDSINVKSGQKVDGGTALGRTGTTGQSTGIHLHLGVQSLPGLEFEDPHAYVYDPPSGAVGSSKRPERPETKPGRTSNAVSTAEFGTGDKVRVKQTGIPYELGGIPIPSWVGAQIHTIDSKPMTRGGKMCYRLAEIFTWVDADNLEKVGGG